jgi:3-hydroxyacyl-CoA dehydrogenase/enoyl-CoA hydratase/3-hydroxybutyryl-CoA epimerase
MISYEKDNDGIVTLTIDDPNAGANTMNAVFSQSMGETLDRLESEVDSITGVIVASGKKTFFAGGDLKALISVGPENAQQVFDQVEGIKALLRRIEKLPRPVVAAINGAALGGGLELALACNHRIAIDDNKTEIGLPEVTLGLLPGAGGVTRTVRKLGIAAALMDCLLQGQRYKPAKANEKGLVDQLVATREELLPAARQWLVENKDNEAARVAPWDVKGYKIPGGTPSTPAFAANLPAFPSNLRKQLKGADMPAPKAIMSAAIEGAQVDFDTASRIESRYFTDLATGPISTNMIQAFFFDLQSLTGDSLRPSGFEKRAVNKVGILGAGMMGAGIAYECARAGMEVVLKDISLAAAEKGKAHSEKLLTKAVERGRMTEVKHDEILSRITPTDSASDLAGIDVLIEAVFEDANLKAKVFAEALEFISDDCLLCSNTSTLPITGLAQNVPRPKDFIGLHFFSPVDKMKLVEIIKGAETSNETVARAIDIVQQIRKIPIVVNDSRGFYTSRVFGTLISEGIAMVGEGVDPMTIERAATQGGFPAPPLAMLDEVSLTLTQHIRAEAQNAAKADGTQTPNDVGADIIDRMVDEFGRKGRAAGAGFYDYPTDGSPKTLWPGVREHFTTGRQYPMADVQDRYRFIMALETAKCIQEGVLTDTASANIGGIFGIGFPPSTGGPAQFISNYEGGIAGFVARAKELAAAYGERFEPSAWLVNKAKSGEGLISD